MNEMAYPELIIPRTESSLQKFDEHRAVNITTFNNLLHSHLHECRQSTYDETRRAIKYGKKKHIPLFCKLKKHIHLPINRCSYTQLVSCAPTMSANQWPCCFDACLPLLMGVS